MKQIYKQLGKVRPTVEGDWSIDKAYTLLSIVYDEVGNASYISRKDVPVGIQITNKEYWTRFSNTRVNSDSIVLLSKIQDDGLINNYDLQEAIDSFKVEDRRLGTFISFYEKPIGESTDYRWNLYQFNSNNIDDWNNIKYWQSIYYIQNKFLGLFSSEESLKRTRPFPIIGDYAFVGATLKEAVVYRCNNIGVWTRTNEKAKDYLSINLKGDITISEEGNWVIDGVDTGISSKGEDGKTPLLRIKDYKWQVSYDGGVIYKDIPNSPIFVKEDDEDIVGDLQTDGVKLLKFADKEYNASKFSGLGRVYLRKNIVNGKNVLTQEMINKTNTIYIIQYDYDLNNKEINIPENCTLDFQGGSLKNGTIVLNNTLISANLYQIFHNITTKGYSPSECQVEWFGAKSYSRINTNFTYSSDAIQDAFNSCFSNIYFNVGVYYIDKTLEMSHYKTLNFKGAKNWTIKTVYNYPIDNINASTLCVLTDIDVLHIKCECKEVPNDINSTIKILGYGVIDVTKVDNYSKTAVKIIIKDVNVTDNIIHLYIINDIKRITTLQQVEEEAKNDYGTSIGIELVNNSTQNGLSIYSTEIDGVIEGFRYGIKNNIPNRCFPTAFIFKCTISQCITAIDFGESSIRSSYVVCNHVQSYKGFKSSTYNDYPLFIGKIINIYFDTYVWDLGLKGGNDIYMHNNIMNLNIEDTPIFSDNFRQFKSHINGNFLSKYNYNKSFDLISSLNSFKRYSDYYIDFLTNDYAFHKDYILENNDNIKIKGNPFNYGEDGNQGLNINPKMEDNGKSFSLNFNVIEYIGITKIFIEYSSSISESYFDNIDIIYYNKENKILINNNYRLKQEKINNTTSILSDVNITYGSSVHHIEIKFNNLNYINDNRIIINIKAMGFRHSYYHINTPQRTIINNDGIFSLHGHKFRSFSNEDITFLENQSNGGKFYSTAGQPRYFKDEDIINAVKASPNAYGNGAQFYKYSFNEGNLVIYDKSNNKYFALKGAILGKATSGTFDKKPNTVPEGYFYLVKDVKSNGKTEFKPIYAKEDGGYIDALGNPANALKKGTTAQRPTEVQIGFTYKDTDLNKWIIWNGEAWENIDGTALG